MAILDKQEREEAEIRAYLGEIIIYCNLVFSLLAVAFIAIKMFIGLRTSYRLIKKSKGTSKNICLQVLIVPFQTGGMGFDEGAIARDNAFKNKKGNNDEISKINPNRDLFVDNADIFEDPSLRGFYAEKENKILSPSAMPLN